MEYQDASVRMRYLININAKTEVLEDFLLHLHWFAEG